MNNVLRNAHRLLPGSYLRPFAGWLLRLVVLLLAGGSLVTYAQTGGDYNLNWWTADSGGETGVSGGAYKLLSTGGQPEAELEVSKGGEYTLLSGFWPGEYLAKIYLSLVLKDFIYAPDLIVVPDSLSASSSMVSLTIQNVGNAPSDHSFWVDVYFNPTVTPSLNHEWHTIASHGVVWGVTTSIPAGGTLTLVNNTSDPYYFPNYSSQPPLPVGASVYALVDSINHSTTYGAVSESNEDNNLYGPVISTAGEGPTVTGQGQLPSTKGLPSRQ
jgi:hypothetical protein